MVVDQFLPWPVGHHTQRIDEHSISDDCLFYILTDRLTLPTFGRFNFQANPASAVRWCGSTGTRMPRGRGAAALRGGNPRPKPREIRGGCSNATRRSDILACALELGLHRTCSDTRPRGEMNSVCFLIIKTFPTRSVPRKLSRRRDVLWKERLGLYFMTLCTLV